MIYNLVIDADSILYKSCYRNQLVNLKNKTQYTEEERKESFDVEMAYIDFVSIVSSLKRMVYTELDLPYDDEVKFEIVFSPKITFRNELSVDYKANRKPSTIFGIGDLKQLVSDRIPTTQSDIVEADDIVITRAYEEENVIIACIDKDIFTHSPVPCINYKSWEWIPNWEIDDIETNYWIQALMGDATDGIKGVEGIGKKKAEKIVNEYPGMFNYDLYRSYFPTEEEAIMSMRLVRLDQFRNDKIELWGKNTIPMKEQTNTVKKPRRTQRKNQPNFTDLS